MTAVAIDEQERQDPNGLTALVGGLERDDLRDLRAKSTGHLTEMRLVRGSATACAPSGLACSPARVRALNAALLTAIVRRAGVSDGDIATALAISANRIALMRDSGSTAALHYGAVVVLCARLPLVVDVVAAVVAAQSPGLAAAIARLESGK